MSINALESWRNRGYCGEPTPPSLTEGTPVTPFCKKSIGHVDIKHEDPYGVTWSTPGSVSGNDRWNHRDEQLRELLSYCKVEAEKFDPDQQIDEFNPYDDVAYKLAAILDGEQ